MELDVVQRLVGGGVLTADTKLYRVFQGVEENRPPAFIVTYDICPNCPLEGQP